MRRILAVVLCITINVAIFAQNIYMTRSGQVSFSSKTSMEDIVAVNNEVTSMLNSKSGEIVFAILIKSFHFERALMEEHFNENYMESDKLPKSTFQGKITNVSSIDFSKNGTYQLSVEGNIVIHGVEQPLVSTGTATVLKGKILITAMFLLQPSDFKIQIPSLVAEKIAKTIDVKVNCQYELKR